MTMPDSRGIYFDSAHLGEPEFNYVCWLDIMGTANQMLRSLPIAAHFIFKLHCAVLEAYDDLDAQVGLRLYPVMDGVYITSQRRNPMQVLVNQALRRMVTTFLEEETPYHQFIARGAVAYGPVYHGSDLDDQAARVLASHSPIRDSILLGLPMAQAYRAERDAPPFAIAAHSSARAFAPDGDEPYRFIWLNWFRAAQPRVDPHQLLERLNAYYDWQKAHSNMTGYAVERIEHHRKLAAEYFTASD